MATQKALVMQERTAGLTLKNVPIPTVTPGSAVVRIHAAGIVPYTNDILSSKRPYPLITPLTFGCGAIGTVDSVGADATVLKPGDLVVVDVLLHARDEPSNTIMVGFHAGSTAESKKLMEGEWRNGVWAEYVKVPLENCLRINREVVVDKLGWTMAELAGTIDSLVAWGGLCKAGVKAGDKVLVAPGTGHYGGPTISLALAMGASVVAAGRNKTVLQKLRDTFGPTGRFQAVELSGNKETDTKTFRSAAGCAGPQSPDGFDCFIDYSPPQSAESGHFIAGLNALRFGGTCALVGGIFGDVLFPHGMVMHRRLTITGSFMYSRDEAVRMIKLIEAGLVRRPHEEGITNVMSYPLEKCDEAIDAAAANASWGNLVVFEV